MILSIVKATVGPLLVKLATPALLKELLLWAADLAVKSTKTEHDDELLQIVRKAWGEED